ncbi:hypothetical protein N7456_000581 [Penicillium angulare]|uniref:F-box domain-containing protein n=1 Tax=Penicillium angulare TaxID=116970 RepID=A0A9W9GCA8_9EURO|nr:hypothetical protein N7456_000581 [Penicillium angulare]
MKILSEKVIFTTEILENVLLHLDQNSLLISAQRVCRYWHDVVSSSQSLQKHLFLQPDWNRSDRTINKLLAETFPPWFPQGPTERRHSNKTQINTIDGYHGTIFETLPIALRHKNKSFRYENATWRRMLVQQPPISDLVSFSVRDSWGGSRFTGPHTTEPCVKDQSFDNENPLNMGTFYDEIIINLGVLPLTWMILWDFGESNVPSSIDDFSLDSWSRRKLSKALKKYGMIVIDQGVSQCMSPFLWTPGRKFVYDLERLKALGVDGYLPEEESYPENPPPISVDTDKTENSDMRSMCPLCAVM